MGWNQTQFGAMCGVTQQTAGRWLVGSSEMKAEIWEWLRAEIFKDLLKQERWPPPSADELIRLLAERDG